jgi:hypothetical protein
MCLKPYGGWGKCAQNYVSSLQNNQIVFFKIRKCRKRTNSDKTHVVEHIFNFAKGAERGKSHFTPGACAVSC